MTVRKQMPMLPELVPQGQDPLPHVYHLVPSLGKEKVLALSVERELALASAKGRVLA